MKGIINTSVYISNLMVESAEEDSEQLAEVHVVRSFIETKSTTIIKIHGELGRITLAQHLHRGRHLLKRKKEIKSSLFSSLSPSLRSSHISVSS